MTFSIMGHCARTGLVGAAVATYSLAAGGRDLFVGHGVGALSSQAFASPALGALALRLLGLGLSPAKVLLDLAGHDPDFEWRQIGIVDAHGRAAVHTGPNARKWAGHVIGDGFVAMGNVLAGQRVVEAIAAGFLAEPERDLDDRLIRALEAGRDAGGQANDQGEHLTERSAGVLVRAPRNVDDVDLRVDAHDSAIHELRRVHGLVGEYRPYYRMRALEPRTTPPQDRWRREQEDKR